MRAYTDRAPGVQLVTDPPRAAAPPPPTPDVALDDDDITPRGLRAWAGRVSTGIAVQGLVDGDGNTYVTVVVAGRCTTREIAPERALEVYLHPFANEADGFEL